MNELTIQETGKMANLRVWSQRVAECRESGMPAIRWCQENGINVKTYYNCTCPVVHSLRVKLTAELVPWK